MSNVGRPRTGLKACPHCGDTKRDSNGQCRCRNTLYRVLRGAPKPTAEKARRVYNDALKGNKGSVDKALSVAREEFPSLAAKARKAPADKAPSEKAKRQAAKERAKNADVLGTTGHGHYEGMSVAERKEADAKKAGPERYVLHVEDEDPKPYARKDAAIKNGVRSGAAWHVVYKGKTVAQSDDLL